MKRKAAVAALAVVLLAAASFGASAVFAPAYYPKGGFKVRWDRDREDSFALKSWIDNGYTSTKDPEWIGSQVTIEIGDRWWLTGEIDEDGRNVSLWSKIKLIRKGSGISIKIKDSYLTDTLADAGVPQNTGGEYTPITDLRVVVDVTKGSTDTLYHGSWYYPLGVHYRYKADGVKGKATLREPHD
jgi:hypothetical protein